MANRIPPIPPPVPADRVSPPMETADLFPDPPEETTTISSVPFQLSTDVTIRTAALDRLGGAYRDAVELSELAFVALVGEPGMGKSHTVRHFADSIARTDPKPRILRSEGDGSGVPYAAFAKLLLARFGVTPVDTEENAHDKIQTTVAGVLDPARVTEVVHLLANMCRLPFPDSPVVGPLESSPQQLETRTYIAVRRFLAADAAQSPLVLCIENLELCSSESINLIHYLAAGLASSKVVILGTARPSLFRVHPTFGDGDVPLVKIELAPLTGDQAVELLEALCHQLDAIPPQLASHAKRLGGSPRAISELIRLLLESEVIVRSGSMSWRVDEEIFATLNLPDSHEDLVKERIRVMAGIESDILEKAAAVGETFWLDGVVAMVRIGSHRSDDPDGPSLAEIAAAGDHTRILVAQNLQTLVDREWIVPVAQSSLAGEHEYRFTYPYLWSCVYEGLTKPNRQRYHMLIAQWLQLRPEESEPAQQESIGRHLELAGSRRAAAHWYRVAAESARRGFHNERATRLFGQALSCLGDSDLAERIALWHDLGSVFELKGDFDSALGAFERMLRLAWTSASRVKAAVAFNKMGRVWRHKGDLDLALEYLQRGQDLFEQACDARGIAGSLDDIGQVLYLLGRYDDAFTHVTQGLSRRGKRGDERSIAHSLSNLGNIQKDRGQFAEAENCHREALEIRRRIGDRAGVVTSLNNMAVLAYERGHYDEARKGWSDALAEAEELGALPLQALALSNLGELALNEGSIEEARRHLADSIELASELSDPLLESESYRNLARLEHQHGSPETARGHAKRAYELAKTAGLRDNQGRALLTLGEVYAGTLFDASEADDNPTQPEMKAAERFFSKGVDLLREIGNQSELAKGLERYGRYKIEHDDVGRGVELLNEALDIFRRLGMVQQAEVRALLASL